MPFVKIDMWKGRDRETLKKMIRNVTTAIVDTIGCRREAVQIVVNEVEKENWGLGGVPADELAPKR